MNEEITEDENHAVSLVINADIVVQHIGYWPTFHDAEVLKVNLEANPGHNSTITFLIETHEFMDERDARGFCKLGNNCQLELSFSGIHEIHLNDFINHNIIFDLTLKKDAELIECSFGSTMGLVASITAEKAMVLSLVPVAPAPEVPLIDIDSIDMSLAANIYTAYEDSIHNFKWSEWVYIGLDNEQSNDYQPEKVNKLAYEFFDEERVYLIEAENSRLLLLDEFLEQVGIMLKTKSAFICNKKFTKAMRFDMIGIMSFGQKIN